MADEFNAETYQSIFDALRVRDYAAAMRMVHEGVDVNQRDTNGLSLLMIAANGDNVDVVRWLLKNGADVLAVRSPSSGYTALHAAAARGHTDIARVLVEAGATVLMTKTAGSPLIEAVLNGHVSTAGYILSQYPKPDGLSTSEAERRHKDMVTALMDSAKMRNIEMLRLVLEAGLPVDATGNASTSALGVAAEAGHLDAVRFLLERGAAVDFSTIRGPQTPLMLAALEGHYPVVRLLLEHGANAEYCLRTGETVTSCAVAGRNIDIIRAVLDAGGILHHDARETRPRYSEPELGLDDDGPQEFGTALFMACYLAAPTGVVRLLLDRGARVNDCFNVAPLIVAAAVHATYDDMSLLLCHGAGRYLNVAGGKELTALLSRCSNPLRSIKSDEARRETARVVELMLEHGANVALRDYNGRSVLQHAVRNRWLDTVKVLLDFGASKEEAFQTSVPAPEDDSASSEDEETASDLESLLNSILNYEPTPRGPKIVPIRVDGVPLFVMPWFPNLYQYAPCGFQREIRALCLLRSRAECEPTWGCLPNEVFELVVAVAWREENIRRQLDVAIQVL